ncbi:MAG: hypothetical protein KatS3mg101_0618 [Patescibacteria group bacterium]|nr:MAG: hypothetical protein KatS3mg101_0618 [Patescibacteria group bacterium]
MPPTLRIIIESASFFGNSYVIATLASVAMLMYLFASGYIKEAGLFFLAVLGVIYSILLKNIYKIPRPDTYIGDPSKLGDMYRFPSSHVVFYVCFWGFLLFLSFKRGIFGPEKIVWLIRFLCVYHILLIGISRVVVGAHMLQDVIAGYLFGGLYLGILIAISLVLNKK